MMAARVPFCESRVLQRASKRKRRFLELAIGEARVFAFAIGFDQADFIGPAIERRAERIAQRIVLAEIQHQGLATEAQRHREEL